jgi:PAS domain S-box-containing protein
MGYWGEAYVFKAQMLVNIGLISFAAVLQFAPVVLGGIFWRRANQAGALLGLGSGFLVWCYTQMIPSFIKNGWLPHSILEHGPGGMELLKPEALFGLAGLDPISHTFLWSMLFNVGGYVLGSLYFTTSEKERSLAEEFAGALLNGTPPRPGQQREAYIDADPKVKEIENLLFEYFPPLEASAIVERCLQSVGIRDQNRISIVQLVELHSEVERMLAGSIGAAAAHQAVRQGTWFTSRESTDLAEVYAEILADLKVTPDELKRKIDYQLEREHLLIQQARELQTKVAELEREILERRRAQEALRESEKRYRGLVETMNEGLAIEDPEGLITYVNDRLCRMWGYTREEIIGRRIAEFLGEAERDLWSKQATRRSEDDRASSGATWTCKDGRKISAIVSSVPLFAADGQYRGSFAVVTDISHLKTMEREKANMISMFAHDMRSSLTGIHGLGLRLLTKSESIDEAKRSDYLRIINKEASKLESLVDDFLEFSRLETGRLKLTFGAASLDKELMELYETYQHRAAQKGLKLELHMEEALPIIHADEKRLRRVFTNLLDNAVKFSKAEGTISLVAQETPREVLVQIIDQGVGIAADELPYIFDLFHRGRGGDKREGYGIGLATVKAIVEGHGGRIQVASEVGKGSTFSIFLPKETKDLETQG